jgi:hypothetical protein
MIWRVTAEPHTDSSRAIDLPGGRFVLHRHIDRDGPHRDLRIEWDGYLLGWRIDGDPFAGEAWALEKGPHSLKWLERNADAVSEDKGTYHWAQRDGDVRRLVLTSEQGVRTLRFEKAAALTPKIIADVAKVAQQTGIDPGQAARLIADGAHARERAIARLCGLGRELDGSTFDEAIWRRSLSALSLDDIHHQLRAYEARFDATYPPQPVSRPEALPGEDTQRSAAEALAILRS